MAQGGDDTARTAPWRPSSLLRRESVRYALAVLGYVVLILVTKDFLTFTWGICYFVVVLEVLPRSIGWLRGGRRAAGYPPTSESTES